MDNTYGSTVFHFHYWWRVKSSFKLVWMESTSTCNSLIGLPIEMALQLFGLAKSHLSKTGFDRLRRDQSSFRPSALGGGEFRPLLLFYPLWPFFTILSDVSV
jgi:hypothetical protein